MKISANFERFHSCDFSKLPPHCHKYPVASIHVTLLYVGSASRALQKQFAVQL